MSRDSHVRSICVDGNLAPAVIRTHNNTYRTTLTRSSISSIAGLSKSKMLPAIASLFFESRGPAELMVDCGTFASAISVFTEEPS